VGPNNLTKVVADPYHMVLGTMKATKNTATILLDRTISIFPMCNLAYKCWGGKTLRWNRPANIPNILVAI
jgi:hypothetical protein